MMMTQTNSAETKYAAQDQMLEEANNLKATGQYKDAFNRYQNCLEQYPECAEAYCSAVKLIEEQISVVKISLKKFGTTHNTEALQNALITTMQTAQASGRFEEALSYSVALCTIDPDNWMFPALTGKLHLNKGGFEGAISAFNVALSLAPDNIQCRDNLLKTFYYLGSGKFDVNTKRWMALFLNEPDTVDIGVLARVWIMLLLTDPDYKEIMKGQQHTDYKNFKQWLDSLSQETLSYLTSDYWLDGLRICVVANINIERLLTHLRRTILSYSIHSKDAPDWATGFASALAEQCFLNEYIYEVTKDEKDQVETLVKALNKNHNITPLSVAALACYHPLNSFPALTKTFITLPESLSEHDRFMFKSVIRQQIEEPEEEQKLKKEIKSFGTINNETSQKVRDQYESNPYPRWISTGVLENDEGDFIFSGSDPLKPHDILIAGCATGHIPIKVCKNYPSSSVMGIDLSLSSLAYGLRKAREMKVNNLELMHGDILELENLKQQFDIIFSSGVLHHMKNPEAGWHVLANILKPGGLMKIGLYSELERQHITACRQYIIDHDIADTPDGIRQIRNIIVDLPTGHPFRKVMPFNDFYSTSMMRDLLFHVQEQCFTIPRIEKALNDFNLEFLAFSMMMPQAGQQYSQMFADDPAMTNLENWDQYEHKYPDTFTGLYQFWCRKKQT